MINQATEFSVIITCLNEQQSIIEFHSRLDKALRDLGRTFEIIFVNDGSGDETFSLLKSLFHQNPNVRVVLDLFKNSGQAAAITAGIVEAQGKHFIFMDSDLQLDPEELPQLVAEFDRGADVVSGFRKIRHDAIGRRVFSKLANSIMRVASGTQFTDFGCTYKIFRGQLLRAFEYGPSRRFYPVEVISRARRCVETPVTHHPRRYGRSGWTFMRLFDFNMENIIHIPVRPFQLLIILTFLVASLLVVRIFASMFLDFKILGDVTGGLLLNMLLIMFLVGVGILAFIGELVIRSFQNLQRAPKYIIREALRR